LKIKEIIPISPVIPKYFKDINTELDEIQVAKNQEQYRVLPSIVIDNNTFLTRWKVPFWHRIRILLFGNLYLEIMHFNNPIQPLYLDTKPNLQQIAGD
jgi:hypothetical protein